MEQDIDPPSASTPSAIARLVDSGRAEEAEQQARDMTRQSPADGGAWRVLGYTLLSRSNYTDAEVALQKALELDPQDAAALEYLGWSHRRAGDHDAAVKALRASVAIDKTRARAWIMLADIYRDQKKRRAAISHYEYALWWAPDHVHAHTSLGELLGDARRFQDAARHRARAAELSPTLTNQVHASHAARRICDWETAERLEPIIIGKLRDGPQRSDYPQPFPFLAMPNAKPGDVRAAGVQVASHHLPQPAQPHRPVADLATQRKLRIGYLTPDMHTHPMAHLSVALFEFHDRSRFETVLFDYAPPTKDNIYRKRALDAFDKVVDIRDLSDAEAAKAIADEGIAIVADISGWTTGNRCQILARRPAPVSVQWMGFPGSMGAPWIDYVVVDSIIAPPGSEPEFSEKLIRLPFTYQSNDRKRRTGEKVTRADVGLPADAFVFCNFNQSFKLNRPLFELWMDLLRRRPNAVLWLAQENEWSRAALQQHARALGVAEDRVIFGPRLPLDQHMARLSLADLALDCVPYGSHTTASDALWVGVPQLAIHGDTFASRVSSSLLTAIGLPELISNSLEEHRDLALRLSEDRALLARYRARLAENRFTTPLFDSAGFARYMEAGYEAIWRRRVDGLPPDHINVPAIV
jgi:predicted O-linked N-acetylglucosamine transferase (SPINDLY family)